MAHVTFVINVIGHWETVGQIEWETRNWANGCSTKRRHSKIGWSIPQKAAENAA